MRKQENVLVIGNGFDLYHFLPTRYVDFLRTINRLLELEADWKLMSCQYIKYLWGPDSPIYQQDEYIKKCYEIHSEKMHKVELNRNKIEELVAIAKNNIWIQYFQSCLEKDIGWIDFEEEIGNVLNAVQRLFLMDSMTNDLVRGIAIDQVDFVDLKTIDILGHLPFVEANFIFRLKEQYAERGIKDGYYVSINKDMILERLEHDLEKLAEALCIYLKEFVQRIAISKSADNPVFYQIDKVLNFNYTDTYRNLYEKTVEMKFIHGSINDERGIVLGINNDSKDELEEMDSSLIRFKKYYQRAKLDTFYSIEDFLSDEDVDYKVAIVGHSIEITDRDILVGLLNHPRTKVTIYYHNEKAHGQQVVNLISLVGKTRFDELRNQKKVSFSQLREFREATAEVDMTDIEEEDLYEYKILRHYRILEDSYSDTNTLLIGNEIVEVSVRDGEVGINEIKMVDHFLNLQEYYNHSGLYSGAVKLVSLFNDNRYCGAGATVEYIKANDELGDDMAVIQALFDTECEGVGICISDVQKKKFQCNI